MPDGVLGLALVLILASFCDSLRTGTSMTVCMSLQSPKTSITEHVAQKHIACAARLDRVSCHPIPHTCLLPELSCRPALNFMYIMRHRTSCDTSTIACTAPRSAHHQDQVNTQLTAGSLCPHHRDGEVIMRVAPGLTLSDYWKAFSCSKWGLSRLDRPSLL
ncbi:hypothetical protein ABBQ38_010337 [Trebouxia sp. C0009 RCD-2024]